MDNTFFKSFSIKSLAAYMLTLAVVSVLFENNFIGWHWVLWGVGASSLSFLGSYFFYCKSKNLEQKDFLLLVFFIALIIRVLYAWLMCYYYTFKTGIPLEFGASDSLNYHKMALLLSRIIGNGQLGELFDMFSGKYVAYSDLGYVFSLGFVYYIFGPNILIPRVLHSLFSAYVCILIYRLAYRIFNERTAKIAAALSVFMPLFIYYCGLHLKEIEFAFFLILCVERIDFVFREKKNLVWNIFLILFSLLMIFLFRISTGICMVLSLVIYLIINKDKMIPGKIAVISVASILVIMACLFFSGMGWEIKMNFDSALHKVKYNFQYLPGAFVLPLPKMIMDGNENQKLMNGMVFVKNIIGFFAMYSFIIAYREKKLREISLVALLPLTYLAIVSSVSLFSTERFYFPVLPCLVVLAAYSVSHFEKKDMKWFHYYLAVLFVAIVIWNHYNVNTL